MQTHKKHVVQQIREHLHTHTRLIGFGHRHEVLWYLATYRFDDTFVNIRRTKYVCIPNVTDWYVLATAPH